MKTKNCYLIAALVAFTMVSMTSCVGCESKEKKQYVDSLFNVLKADSLYTLEQRMEALDLLIKERSWQKEDLEKLREMEKQIELSKINDMANTADSMDVDTSAVVTRGGSESEGFGRCWESGCHCKAFKGRGDTCGNCGHAYRQHS